MLVLEPEGISLVGERDYGFLAMRRVKVEFADVDFLEVLEIPSGSHLIFHFLVLLLVGDGRALGVKHPHLGAHHLGLRFTVPPSM